MKALDQKYTVPGELGDWWDSHAVFSKFNRQGIDIVCARFEHKHHKAIANIMLVTGWSEAFLKYAEVIKILYERGFNIYTYDHQSQGLSGRWLSEPQSTWIHSFEDYVDDFSYYATSVSKEYPSVPLYVVAHSMGGLVVSIALSRFPTLFSRAVLLAPMIRNKCGMKVIDYKYPLPQSVTYWLTDVFCRAGLGTLHALGYFKEKPSDLLPICVATSDRDQLNRWQSLRELYPQIMSTCVTNDWVVQAIRAQRKFATRYPFVQTNALVFMAEHDVFVYNRAIQMFVQQAPSTKLIFAPHSYHELLFEADVTRGATMQTIVEYLTQDTDSVEKVKACFPLVELERDSPLYSVTENVFRASGLLVASFGMMIGVAMMFGKRKG